MPAGIIYQIAEDFNREVKARATRASSELVRAYGEIWKKLNAEILRLTKEYQASNSKDALLWLNERGRLRVLQAQIEVELRQFADKANQETRTAQEEVIREAQLRAEEGVAALAMKAGVDLFWNKIDPRVLTQMVGVLQKGSPLDKILRGYGDEAVESMGNKLLNGLAMGLGPREIARNIRIDMAMDLTRALRISRTEIIRAKRESSRLSYKENPKLIGGYIRRSARQSSTCAACWALDGVIYPLDTPLDDHPNGMCYEVPYIPELDKFYDRSDTGASAFEKLSDDEKREILGPAKFEGYKQGLFGIGDMVTHSHSDEWGEMATETSLKSLVGEDEAKKLLYQALGGEEKTVGFSFLSGDLSLQSIEEARALGLSEEGWAKYRKDFSEKWLKPYKLVDDLLDTIGYWKGPEPSFNLKVFGSIKNVEKFADAWGAQFNQQSMAILNPKAGASGGKFAWKFDESLSDAQMNKFFRALDEVNDLKEVQDKELLFGVTTIGSKSIEYWFSSPDEASFVETYLLPLIKDIGIGFHQGKDWNYEFYFRSQEAGDY